MTLPVARPFLPALVKLAALGLVLTGTVVVAPHPAKAQSWATCLEAIASTQEELKKTSPKPKQPPTQSQSIAAQDSADPSPESLAAAGLNPPTSGAAGALNEAMNLQAAGDEAGCMKAVDKARTLMGAK